MDRDYKKELLIDKYDLDNELVHQGRLYADWVEFEADAAYLLDRAERKLKSTKAEVGSEVRANPSDYGWEEVSRPTEPFIKECIENDKRVKAAYKRFHEKKKHARVMENVLWAFTHRKESVGYLCGLYGKQYYSRPYVEKEVRENHEKRTREGLEAELKDNPRMQKIKETQ